MKKWRGGLGAWWAAVLLGLAGCASVPIELQGVALPQSAPIAAIKSAQPIIALVLGSGGSRGFAHVGVIKTLEAQGIVPDIVVGSSAGSVVGVLYAGGYRGAALEEIALKLEKQQVRDFTFPSRGFIRGIALQDFVNQALHNRSIEQFDKSFAAVATELDNGKLTVFNRGNAGAVARVSSSIPGVFQPVAINGHEYVDGDLVSPVPVKVAQAMGADIVIAVDVSRQPENGNTDGYFGLLFQTIRIMRKGLIAAEIGSAQVVIRPDLGEQRPMDFDLKRQTIQAGEQAAQAALPEIRAWIERVAAQKRLPVGGGQK